MSELDPRLNAYRPDLAAEPLKGRIEAARYSAGHAAQVIRGTADLRRNPGAAEPLDTQLLLGETVTVYDERDGWAWVQNQGDGYVGYVEGAALSRDVHETSHTLNVLRSFLYPIADLKAPPLDALSMGARLAVVGARGAYSELRLGTPGQSGPGSSGYVYTRHLAAAGEAAPDYVATALEFIGVPYLWGGKDSLGLDCSALLQVALNRAGIPCPRDSSMQTKVLGEAVAWEPGRTKLQRGDLIYFPGHCAIALDARDVVNANAHAMMVSIEPLAELEARVKEDSGGTGITAVRRL